MKKSAHATRLPLKSKFTTGAFASWQAARPFSLRAFAKRSYRMPTFNDLYYTDMGNAYLKPETATQYDGGLTLHIDSRHGFLEAFHLSADAYLNNVTDKIIAYPKGQQFRWTMLNLGRVRITGIDAQMSFLFRLPAGISLTTKVQYTYQDAIDITDKADNYYRDQIPYIPWNSRFSHCNGNMAGMAPQLQFHLHRRALQPAGKHPLQLYSAMVHERPVFAERHCAASLSSAFFS